MGEAGRGITALNRRHPDPAMTVVHGEVLPGWEPVRDAFAANFERFDEIGAACAVVAGGRTVVDLWAGAADVRTGAPWQAGTRAVTFSTTKGATSVVVHRLVEQGRLDLDTPVSASWPEFAAAGKEAVPVRWLLTHQAGLPAVDRTFTPEELFAWHPMVEALAAQAPHWPPGTAHGYHAMTFGWLVGEVVRRVSGRSVGELFAAEVAAPLGLEYHIGGLPAELEPLTARLSGTSRGQEARSEAPAAATATATTTATTTTDPSSLSFRALNPTDPPLRANDPAYHRAEMPAANGIGTARALARMYAALLGEVDGVRLLQPATVAAATTRQTSGIDRVTFRESAFGLGFALGADVHPAAGAAAFGHPGMGGSLGYADPELGFGFGYVMNRMRPESLGDPRAGALVEAARSCAAATAGLGH